MQEMDPKRIVRYMNCFHDAVSAAIIEQGGIVTQIQGDSATAVFGVPFENEDDTLRAVTAALNLQRSMEDTNKLLQGLSLPAMNIGIGISTGDATCGAIGPQNLTQYQVFGVPLQLASEMEKIADLFGSPILVCSITRELVKDAFHIRQVDVCSVRGQAQSNTIFEIMGSIEIDLKHDVMTVFIFFNIDNDMLRIRYFRIQSKKLAVCDYAFQESHFTFR